MNSDLLVERLSSNHNRSAFSSGNTELDGYLKRLARQDEERRICRVFVLTQRSSPDAILGFYTLSASSIELTDLPPAQAKRLPRHPVPAALLGRIAVRQDSQGTGLGGILIADAIKRSLSIADEIGIFAMIVDAIDDSAIEFYQHFGFDLCGQSGRRLFLQLKQF
jgi:GNAT superfamily N-acetyltransferase